MATPRELLSAAYADRADAHRERDLRRRAAGFEPDERMERVLALRADNPADYASLSTSLRTAAGFYEGRKQAAAELADLEKEQ